MSFPFETELEIETTDEISVPNEYGLDFATGQFTGTIVKGLDAVKIWIYKALNAPRYRHLIYSWNYGNDLEDLIESSFTEEYTEIEAKRMVEDALLINENIIGISDFVVTTGIDKLTIEFTAETLLGEVEISV